MMSLTIANTAQQPSRRGSRLRVASAFLFVSEFRHEESSTLQRVAGGEMHGCLYCLRCCMEFRKCLHFFGSTLPMAMNGGGAPRRK